MPDVVMAFNHVLARGYLMQLDAGVIPPPATVKADSEPLKNQA